MNRTMTLICGSGCLILFFVGILVSAQLDTVSDLEALEEELNAIDAEIQEMVAEVCGHHPEELEECTSTLNGMFDKGEINE